MPFRHVAPGQFNLDTLKLMQKAFDTVCLRLNISESDPRRAAIATAILEAAADGEREQLSAKAEEALRRLKNASSV